MGAILGGTMRSPFTGIVFALELTHDVNMLLPLLVAVTIAHGFTVLTLRRSILTEKVSRRGFHLEPRVRDRSAGDPVRRADSRSAIEVARCASSAARSQSAHGVGRVISVGVTCAQAPSAYLIAPPSSAIAPGGT